MKNKSKQDEHVIKYDSEINNLSNHSRIKDSFLIKGGKNKDGTKSA